MVFTTEKQNENTQNLFFRSFHLTDREIDVLACLHNGVTIKKMALILNLKITTARTHTYKMMQKLGKNTQESAVEYAEKEGQGDYLTARGEALVKHHEFNKIIRNLAKKIGSQKKICHIMCDKPVLLEELRQDLRRFGIKVVTRHVQTSVARMTIITMPSKGNVSNITAINGCLVYTGDYYDLFWDVLEEVVIHPAVEEARLSFEETFAKDSLADPLDKSEEWDRLDSFIDRLEATAGYREAKQEDPQFGRTKLPLWKRFKPLYYGPLAAFIMGCFALPALQETSLFSTKSAVRSALSLPTDAYLLERPALLSKIANAFKSKGTEKIQIVVLVGMGGMGKTTLARHYARKQSLPVIFELAAQNPKTLLSSFAKLAFALAETALEKKELESWQQIENTKAYESKLLPFVAKKLKEKQAKQKKWLLVFDNVEQFEDIESLFPKDPAIWGNGNILITTRNEHMAYRDNVDPDHVITITPLSAEEQSILFKKVVHRPLTKVEQKELSQFLTKLPPFPLDVMIAAHYIKRTKTSYNAYLRHLTEMHRQFEASQHVFLTRATSYDQTRLAIISSAVKQIVAKDPAFVPLLWVISHLGNQSIPKDLLIFAGGQLVVDRFVDELSCYSLLTGDAGTDHKGDNSAQILLHQSTQHNMRLYLENSIDEKQKQRYNDELIRSVEAYCHQMMVPSIELGSMQDFEGHLQALLNDKISSLSPLHRSCIQVLLGSFYSYLLDPLKAKSMLQPALNYLISYYKNDSHPRLLRALLFSGVTARLDGDYTQARTLLERSVSLLEKTVSADSSLLLAFTLRHLAYVYKSVAEYEKAKIAAERSVALYLRYAPHHGDLAMAFSELATVYYGGPGDYEKAIVYRLKSLEILLKNEGKTHPYTLLTYGKLGMDYRRVGDYANAQKALITRYKGYKTHYPKNLDPLSVSATKLGEIYRLLGDAKQAEFFLKEGGNLATQYFGPDHIHTSWSLIPLGQLYIDMGRYEEAKSILEKSLIKHQKKFGDTNDKTISVYHPLGLVYAGLGEYHKALFCFRKSQKSFAKHYGSAHIDYAIFLKDFGLFYVLKGDFEQAEVLLNQSLAILEAARHIERYRCFEYLGDLYACKHHMLQNSETAYRTRACEYYQKALTVVQAVFLKESFHIARIEAKRKAFFCATSKLS